MLCFPVLMHPGHQQESLWGEGQGWEHPVCTLCIWDEDGWDRRMLSSTSLLYPKQSCPDPPVPSTAPACLRSQSLPGGSTWHFHVSPGHTGRSDPDISLCKRKAKMPENTFIELSWSCAGIRRKWEHHTDMTGRWEGRSEAHRCLLSPAGRTWGGCHTCSLPFNKQGTKYLRRWEQEERNCPCPTQCEVKQGLLPSTCTPLLLLFWLTTAKINNATKINIPAGGTVLEAADHYYKQLHSGRELGFGRSCSSCLLPNDVSKRFSLTKLLFWLKYLFWDYTRLVLQVQPAMRVLQVQSASQMNSSGWLWYIFWIQQFFHAVGQVKLALGACQQAC